ncbi:MAG: NADP(H)-dependent aldo-keto reductase [Gammaproteobacteria bacterium]|nr:NADP(H)-dependent aldo-keto reductase [Gammaproteobacteria bacterium]
MRYRTLGRTHIKVTAICLGTMTFGEQNAQPDAHAQLDYALDSGVNFIDTAELYPVPPKAETYGRTEECLGTWFHQRKNRAQCVLATKVCGRASSIPYVRGGKARLDRKNIEMALNASLKRLQTDYIDLYQPHWPDRVTNFFGQLGYQHVPKEDAVPIEETMEALDALVSAGKVRCIGIANETPWGAMQYLRTCEERGFTRIVSIQNPYNLLNRTFEIGLAEVAHREDVGLLAYSPLAFGVLSGKYTNDARPKNARLTLFRRFERYTNPQGQKASAAYVELAREHGLDPAQMALAFVHSRSFLTSTLVGATSLEQLKANIASLDLPLSDDVLEAIEAIHTSQPNPCP